MEAITRKLRSRRASEAAGGRKLSSAHGSNDSILSSSETDGAFDSKKTADQARKKDFMDMPPDKQLEERVLLDCNEYLIDNLPADDIAPMMMGENLLTPREYEDYKAMKRSGKSTICLSEYLLECLPKRKAGFLRVFCSILRKIAAAEYLGDHIRDAYNMAVFQGGFNPSTRDRLSKVSISDPDIRSKTPQGSTTQACVACKKLRKRNRQLEKFNAELREQVIELDRDYHQLQEAKTKIEAHFETLLDQVKQQEIERQNLMGAIPKLQEAITLIERGNRGMEPVGMQQTLKRIGSLMTEQNKRDKTPTVMRRRNIRIPPSEASRDSILSMFSDTSSVADSYAAEEETSRSSGNTKADEIGATVQTSISQSHLQNKTSSEVINKSEPLVTSKHRPKISDKKTVGSIEEEPVTQISTGMTANEEGKSNHIVTPSKSQDVIKSMKEVPQGHIRQKSSDPSIKQRSNTHPRKATRHHSVSGISKNPTKQGRSQSFRHGIGFRETLSPQRSQPYLQEDDELQLKLAEQRKKLNLQSSTQ